MRGTIRIVISVFILILLGGVTIPGYTQSTTTGEDFGTGHIVRGAFLEQYAGVRNPLDIYGLPITGEFEGMSTFGITTVQYFNKSRFDLVKDLEGNDKVVVANLGELMYPGPGPLAPVSSDGPTCRKFPSTGKSVCYAFLQYYDANDGAVNFGDPISDLEIREGRYVQYFQKARMEWVPELEADSHVVLTDLGKRYFDFMVGDPDRLRPEGSSIPGKPRKPQAYAFVASPLITAGSQQTLNVVVVDMFHKPVANAQVWVFLLTPDGRSDPYRASDTNADGISSLQFPVGDLSPTQIVELEVKVTANGEEAAAKSWYRIWY
ncbi:MAG TPA: hypothetical protein VN364_14405 [Bellilinea sp.]|nr:hypothetical protein [Bellilinea sp.]